METLAHVDALVRFDRRRRLFPPGAACSCGVSNPLCLVLGSSPLACRKCDARGRGVFSVQLHHLGGRPSRYIVPVPANVHAVLSFLQDIGWRGRVPPGSKEAFCADIVALVLVSLISLLRWP